MMYRIVFTETELFAGSMRDIEHSTKWMTEAEIECNQFLHRTNARVVARPPLDLVGKEGGQMGTKN